MRFRNIRLKGYRGVPHTSPVVLDDLKKRNFFVGQNNTGKSAVFRFLQTALGRVKEAEFALAARQSLVPLDANWWWSQEPTEPVEGWFRIEGGNAVTPSGSAGSLMKDGVWELDVKLVPVANDQVSVIVAPRVHIGGDWKDLVRVDGNNSKNLVHLSANGEYVTSTGADNLPYHAPAELLLKELAEHVTFFDPIRAVDRQGGTRGMFDGSELLRELHEWQMDGRRAPQFERFRTRLVAELNTLLFSPAGMALVRSFEVKGPDIKDIYFAFSGGDVSIPLEHMGTGIAEVLILFSKILRSPDGHIFCLEEPETHLHPSLIQRIMTRISDVKSQFLVSTHSNVAIDSIGDEDSIFHFVRQGGGCVVRPCTTLVARHQVLDDLGVSASSLLQVSCVIWVEGPSDRLYLREWIRIVDPTLQEGADYGFVFYGGKVLASFSFLENEEDFIQLIKVSRFSAVLMDRDRGPADTKPIAATKQRILDEAKADTQHRFAAITTLREIENDVPAAVMVAALEVVAEHSLTGLILTGVSGYEDEVLEHLALGEGEAKTLRTKLGKKVDVARRVIETGALPSLPVPEYVERIVGLIHLSRTPSQPQAIS